MSLVGILLVAFGVAVDAAVVSAARGLAAPVVRPRDAVLIALFFGGFQALMPLLGFYLGDNLGATVAAWDHWLAFGLLAGVGAKMLWEARESHEALRDDGALFGLQAVIGLAIATSIDAFAVGITLPLIGAPLWTTIAAMGLVTALLSLVGLWVGHRFGVFAGQSLDALGGVVLIGLGAKALAAHYWP